MHSRTIQEQSLIAVVGADISNPSKIPQVQWQAVCAQLSALQDSQRAAIAKCSHKLANLFDVSETKCSKPGQGGDSGIADPCKQFEKVVRLDLRAQMGGMSCKSAFRAGCCVRLSALNVALNVFSPFDLLLFDLHRSPVRLPSLSQFGDIKASGLDLSDPSTFQSQLSFVCGQLAVTDEKDYAELQKCAPEIAQTITSAKKNCAGPIDNPAGLPGTGGGDDDSGVDCKAVKTLVRF